MGKEERSPAAALWVEGEGDVVQDGGTPGRANEDGRSGLAFPSFIRFARGCMPACPAHPPHLHAVVPPTLYEQSGSEKCGQSANSRGKMRGASALVDASQP